MAVTQGGPATITKVERVDAPSAAEVAINVEGLSAVYVSKGAVVQALTSIDLCVRQSEILGIIGESGSGKSTLGRAILGLLPPQGRVLEGIIEISNGNRKLNIVAAERSELRAVRGRLLALIPQATAGALAPIARVDEQFAMTLAVEGIRDKAEIRIRSLKALIGTGLSDPERVLRSYPHQLSGGMSQRVVLALATLLEPRILVADEPTSSLDVTTQRLVLDNLSKSVRANRRACLLVTHDLRVAGHYCDRILVMYAGYAVESGPAADVLQNPRHPYTRALLAAVPGKKRRQVDAKGWQPRADVPGAKHCPYWRVCRGDLDPRCAEEMPKMREVAPGHEVRTFCA